ncbi:hypothetical protein EW146_g2230 [Bondarzewia mesenterica]|uniref:Uncharacterized protein n=1 Tax=Bondarzewia mesenterica TaxID=1095465 RepID=A0A4S4M1A3_9AGAM|nr:hypothetical protein EW146_g2230 [Bondarzewia mesenterica]
MSYHASSLGCCAHVASSPASIPSFLKQQVEGGRTDGYWIEAFPFRAAQNSGQNLIGYGLGFQDTPSKIEMFINPFTNEKSSNWESRQLAVLDFPVAMNFADISGNGFNDVIISDKYGPSMNDIWPNGGRVSWLENTGDPDAENWTRRTIGFSPGMHRLKAGHFTTKDRIQICAVPIVVKSSDLTTPTPVIIFTAPDDPKSTGDSWPSEVVMKKHLVHEVVIFPSLDGGLDRVLLAGGDGVDLIWFDNSAWKSFNVGKGHPQTSGNPYWGAGSVAAARVHDDIAGYIASSEAFHGNTVSVYTKSTHTSKGIVDIKWTRHVLEDFGPLNDQHTGSIHEVVCADIDGDGIDEVLVAMMGSDPPSFDKTGVWCYKPVDLENGTFSRFKLSNVSAGRIAVADYLSNGRLDFATISYSVPGYFESPNPAINIFPSTSIIAEKLNDEVCFRVPRAPSTRFASELEFLDVSARKLAIVVLPPNTAHKVPAGSAVKVMAGTVTWLDGKSGKIEKRVLATRPFTHVSMSVNADEVRSQDEGAIFMLLKDSKTSGTPPYSTMDALVAHNIIPLHYPEDVCAMRFPWVKVEDRPWANGRFKGLEFYNLVGFHVRYADDSDDVIAHVQLWTAGVGVSAGFHNHVEKSFCEIHACIVNGTAKGGMRWAIVPDDKFNPDDPKLDDTGLIIVPDLHEHGPLWRTGRDGFPLLRKNDTVDYPWHAWLAGDKSASGKQSYDVWIAFEFPSFATHSVSHIKPHTSNLLKQGRYILSEPFSQMIVGLLNCSATDGTPVVAFSPSQNQTWDVSNVTGTDLYQLTHAQTGSLLAARWPPVDGQHIMGTHSPANMSLTSSWAITVHRDACVLPAQRISV